MRYVLASEYGELRKPKDHNQIEIALTPELESDSRVEILTDLHQQGAPLAPGFLRQLGLEVEADVLEARLQNVQEQMEEEEQLEDSAAEKKRKRRPKGDTWTIDCIVDERTSPTSAYRVRWVGYHPTWEPYERAGGEPGTVPLETWDTT